MLEAGQSANVGPFAFPARHHRKTLVWEEKAPVSVARNAGDGVEELDGKLYFVGGWTVLVIKAWPNATIPPPTNGKL